ncbi:putative monooxygenase [Nocardia nova SH22a]|uniref:Putative monooxygenase n=1 Tax=Nocardia nova SH22a TaxID=1415166 RepID=W5TC19_9NOCA|nr:NAD(P)/FAD-dependent oxidoreductase [Nocardia nova]AHH16729.1 putative monooxygenase [Nocardia nova SH22a]
MAASDGALAEHTPIAVIGAGIAGIGLAVALRAAGFEDFLILERADDLGGTWQANTYPGCACDVPSQLYSYSFAPNPDWSRTYGRQPEILGYLRGVAEDHDAVRHMRFGAEVRRAEWEESQRRWIIDTGSGVISADVLISAVGPFSEAKIPNMPGRENFRGAQFHSLHWDHDHDLTGERIAVIGTGASAVQFIPEIAPKAQRLTVFQRSAPWIVSRFDRPTLGVERALLRRIPALNIALRGAYYAGIESFGLVGFVDRRFRHPFQALSGLQLRRQVRDPELRRTLTPDYMIGCKRAIFSDAYYPALTRENVEVVTSSIAEIRAESIVTTDGTEYPVDTIVWGTGFGAIPELYDRIAGVGGRTVADHYRDRPSSYLGAAIAGFPNMFLTLGPFGAAGNQSAIFMIESQIAYIVDALKTLRDNGIDRVEVRAGVQRQFLDEMRERSRETVWLGGGCDSYYTNDKGENAGLYPNWSFEYRRRVAAFDAQSYLMSRSPMPSAEMSSR